MNSPDLTPAQVERQSLYLFLPFVALPVFHHIKFCNEDQLIVDAIHVQLAQRDKQGRVVPARFDTAFVNINSNEARLNKNIHGMCCYPKIFTNLTYFLSRLPCCSNPCYILITTKSHQETFPSTYWSPTTPCICWMVYTILHPAGSTPPHVWGLTRVAWWILGCQHHPS